MTHTQRMEALLGGKKLETAAINLWKHFPPYDEHPTTDLVEKCKQFQQRFGWDFVKITFQGFNSINDFGAKIYWPERDCMWPNTSSKVGRRVAPLIRNAQDWKKLVLPDVKQGVFAENVECTRILADYYKGEVPIIPTVFNPITTCMKMADDYTIIHARTHPDEFKAGLEVITQHTVNYVKALKAAGAAGIFLATQVGTYDKLTLEEYKKWGEPGDRAVLEAADGMWLNIMHMHGEAPMFELMEKYPVAALNFHDRLAEDYNLKIARSKSSKLLMGGVDEFKTLLNGSEAAIRAEMENAFEQVGDGKLLLAPGCCVPLNVSEERLELANNIAKSLKI